MSIFTAIAIYFIIWWITLFAILPWAVTSQHETINVTDGTEPSAPVKPYLLQKAIVTTIVSLVIFGFVYWVIVHSGLRIEDIPILGQY